MSVRWCSADKSYPTYLRRIVNLAELIDKVQHGDIAQHVVPFTVIIEYILQGEIARIVDDESQAGGEWDRGREVDIEVSLSAFLAPTQNTRGRASN